MGMTNRFKLRAVPAALLASAAALISIHVARADFTSSDALQFKVKPAVAPKVVPFPLADVRLLDGPFKEGQDRAVKYLLSLEPDRFLANFRKEAGLPPKARHYGGWESQGVSGHAGGHYLSACALAYAATGDRQLLDRVNYFVDELAACQQANGNGYVAAIPNGKKVYAELAAGNIRSAGFDLNGCWVPNYTMHKVFAGLRDAYRLGGNTNSLAVERGLADWYEKTHANLIEEQMQKILVAEHGGLNETFADLYADTGDERYLKLSRRFHHRTILEPLARQEDILPGKHANTQIPKIIGLATRYELTGDANDRAAAAFFWDRVVNHHSYVTGGHCDSEHFGAPDKLNDRLSTMTTETCNVYNMLKLTEHVFGWDANPAAADFYERALLNHIRSTQHPDGRVIYNLSLKPGHHKEYQSPYDGFTCCVGSGMENHVKYGEAIYFHDADDVWVNLYLASELRWRARGVTLRQETAFPYGDTATFMVSCERPGEWTLHLRRPYWATQGMNVRVNGEAFEVTAKPSSYVALRRTWKNGDKVEVTLPMALRTESMPDNPKRIAIFHGPTLLAANLGPVNDPAASGAFYVPALVTDGRPVADWVKPVAGEKLAFETKGVGRPRDVRLEPFFALHDRRYTVYLDEFDSAQWQAREASYRAEQERLKKLEARTLDVLRIGEMQPERDHELKGEKTSAGEALGRKWRHAIDGGWFAFKLKVQPGQANELVVTYWGSDGDGNRLFDILIDDRTIATQRLEKNRPEEFFNVTYIIPPALTQGKSEVTVKFQAHPDSWAGGVFGVRLMKPE
jgi:DUF1680 family protein